MAQDIADGLMRSKNLQILRLDQNRVNPSSIIYNISFQPCIKLIDISGVMSDSIMDLNQSLLKLLQISSSIESLLLSETGLLCNLSEDFCLAIGQSQSLRHVYLD